MDLLRSHWEKNKDKASEEKWGVGNVYTNNWASPTYMVSVEDTGSGMTDEFVRKRLFRPFDSTKGSQGMGIGVYHAREYMRRLGGNLEVESAEGSGTTMTLRVPIAADNA